MIDVRSKAFAAVFTICGLAMASVAQAADPGSSTRGASDDVAALVQRLGLQESPRPVAERPGWRKPRKVLVWNVSPEHVPALQAAAPGVELLLAKDAKEALALAGSADAVIGFCSAELLAAGPDIRWVQTYSAGVERCVSVPAVRERDILVTNMQRVAGPVMAEHVIAMMLAFARGLDFYIPERLQGRWTTEVPPPARMTTVEGKTVLVVGLGGIGTEVARRAHGLGMVVDAVRASGREGPEYVREVGLPADLLRLAARADFVVNTTPLTPETRGLFDAKFFDTVKRGSYFFNVGRGQSVVQPALVAALRDGRLSGAGLDVTEPEPLPQDDPLWRLPNVILTPHVSTRSELGDAAAFALVRENVRRYVAGERMLSVVDVGRGY